MISLENLRLLLAGPVEVVGGDRELLDVNLLVAIEALVMALIHHQVLLAIITHVCFLLLVVLARRSILQSIRVDLAWQARLDYPLLLLALRGIAELRLKVLLISPIAIVSTVILNRLLLVRYHNLIARWVLLPDLIVQVLIVIELLALSLGVAHLLLFLIKSLAV